MKAVPYLIAIIFAVFAFILLRFLVKRISLFVSLRRFSKKNNYHLHITPICLLPINYLNSIIQIETVHTIYRIKLFGLLRKHCEIHFWNLQHYATEWYFSRYGFVGTTPIGLTNTNRRRSLGNRDWITATDKKDVIPIILISPAQAPVRLTKTEVTHFTDLRAGDTIEDVLFADMDFMLRYIEKREKYTH